MLATYSTVDPHLQLKWLSLLQNEKFQRQLGSAQQGKLQSHQCHRPQPGQWLCEEAAAPGITRRKIPDSHYKKIPFPSWFCPTSSPQQFPVLCRSTEEEQRTRASPNPTWPPQCFTHLISSSFYAQHFIFNWLLHCSGQTTHLLSASFWTRSLFSSLSLGVLLSQCDEADEKLEKQQNKEGHVQDSYSKSFSSLGGTFTLCLQFYLHLF